MESVYVPHGSIVVGVDGSASGDDAVTWSVDQARIERRPLILAHGLSHFDSSKGGALLLDQAREGVLEKAPGLDVRTQLGAGDPRSLLLDLANAARMIVVGSHGRGPAGRLLLGSVSLAVSEHASCPVVVLRPRQLGTVRHGILVGIDASPQSRAALEFSYRQASLHSLPLTVLHCFMAEPGVAATTRPVRLDEPGMEDQRLALDEAVAGLGEKFPEVNATVELRQGSPEHVLVRESQRMNLLVIGRGQKDALEKVITRATGRSVLEHARCVVASVPG